MSLSEADTRAKLIDPALHSRGWTEEHIKREETAGAIEIVGGKPRKRARGRLDYTLRVRVNSESQPVAVALVEAKAEHLPPAHGLEQGKAYADGKRLNVPFVYATNGRLFVEFDRFTGFTSDPRPLTEFPTPDMLRARYEQGVGFSLTEPVAQPLLARYPLGEASRRYYQDAAIRAVFEKVARAAKEGRPKRALLSLATGSGKTHIAVNLLRRIADAGQLHRALFVCDRDELRSQAAGAFQALFGADAATVSSGNAQRNARVIIATYQTLGIDTDDADGNFLVAHYPPNYFSHIVIDECHRSAWGKWSQALTRNPDAVQIGLTATPRQIATNEDTPEARADAQITADNIEYFGPPVYEYDIGQGIEDGYLAACEVQRRHVNLDDTGISLDDILAHHPIDADTGQPVTRADLEQMYQKTDYEDRILLPDRVLAMCQDLFQHLRDTGGPEQKTIIFCVRDRHADAVATTMNNLYAAWCADNQRPMLDHYAFKCTAAGGSDYLSELRGAPRSHFVACTVDLLTTGVDVPALRNVVFFKYVRSPIAFYQMVGRGTRLDPSTDKLMFRVYDYTNATRLFGEAFLARLTAPRRAAESAGEYEVPVVQVEGFDVRVTNAGRYILAKEDGAERLLTVEEYRQRLAARLVQEAPTLEALRAAWVSRKGRQALLDALPDGARAVALIQQLTDMGEYDLYDVLAEMGYGAEPRTRQERAEAFVYKQAGWLAGLPPATATAVQALAAQFARAGIEALENPHIFETPEVVKAGGLPALKKLGRAADILHETKERLLAA